MTTWIERTARKKSIGQVVLFLLVTAIVAWIFAKNRDYWKVFLHGPPPAAAADLDGAEWAANNLLPIATPYVTFSGEKILNTGVQEVTTYEGVIKNVSAGYYALKAGDRIIPVGTTYAAELNFTDGKAEISGNQKKTDELLALAGERSPWAAKGYSDDLAKFYKSSRNSFEAEVAKHKNEMRR